MGPHDFSDHHVNRVIIPNETSGKVRIEIIGEFVLYEVFPQYDSNSSE